MSSVPPIRLLDDEEPAAPHARALENLRFIRETMDRAGAFTAVSGAGICLTGGVALAAAAVAPGGPSSPAWLRSWFAALGLAIVIVGWATIRKARAARVPLLTGVGRRFLLAFSPPMAVGALLTVVLVRAGQEALLPGMWLTLYGTAIVGAGTFSVHVVPAMGVAFMALGTVALFAGPAWADRFMALGFGGLHVAFGAAIARGHGG